jgi:hypothetical protein
LRDLGVDEKLILSLIYTKSVNGSIIRVIKSRRMRLTGHVARMVLHIGFWWESEK